MSDPEPWRPGDVCFWPIRAVWYLIVERADSRGHNARIIEVVDSPRKVGDPAWIAYPKGRSYVQHVPDDEVPERIWAAIARLKLEGRI